jgi:hypothetical protein
MHRFRLPFAGLVMVGMGGFLLFATPQNLPLWFVWLGGAFLWYAGLAVTIGGLAVALFFAPPKPDALEEVRVLKLQRFARQHPSPSGILREIPAMGGFIL